MTDESFIRKVRIAWLFGAFIVSAAGYAVMYEWHEQIWQSRAIMGWALLTVASTLVWLVLLGDMVVNRWRRWRRP